ncbi:hypothetical protein ACH5RR_037685 [Cinchona calisaya]|uniref:F-box domain-containing protein n=1 Tax=Cinchona calisaya TaxID=153742 RepID=A0ABD2Y898_9GENT
MMMMDSSSSLSDVSSKIPDDILIDILSRLSMKEAARTSVLSHNWQNLWKLYSGCLDFDDLGISKKLLYKGERDFHAERTRYVEWVNQVLVSHQAPSIQQFRAHFDLDKDHSSVIESWIQFAAAKRVRRLELDLSPLFFEVKELEEIYNLPIQLLGELNLKLLTSLRLNAVNVSEEHVLGFLSECPLLEELSITGAPSLRKLKVVGGGNLKLKHLEIMGCLKLARLEVSGARSLASFKYEERFFNMTRLRAYMHFQDVPQLSSAYFGRGSYSLHLATTLFKELPFPISQLRMLSLDTFLLAFNMSLVLHEEFPQFTNLRHLELAFGLGICDEQQGIFEGLFLRASPRLHKLVLKYDRGIPQKNYLYTTRISVGFGETQEQLAKGCKYECLKEVEFLGWNGLTADTELFTHLIEAAGSLEKVTVDPRNPFPDKFLEERILSLPKVITSMQDARDRARDRARDLEAKLSPATKLVVL